MNSKPQLAKLETQKNAAEMNDSIESSMNVTEACDMHNVKFMQNWRLGAIINQQVVRRNKSYTVRMIQILVIEQKKPETKFMYIDKKRKIL